MRCVLLARFLLPLLPIAACDRAPSACPDSDPTKPGVFAPCSVGSGSFGRWLVDEYGLPAYEYQIDQQQDPRARWWNTVDASRTEHWHLLGNQRVMALAYNLGTIQLFVSENGYKWLNAYQPQEHNFAGGYSYVRDGPDRWATAQAFAPQGAKHRRLFGVSYSRNETSYRGLAVVRKTYAPVGDDPFLLSDVILTNQGNQTKNIDHFEYWDVNLQQNLVSYVSSGLIDASIPAANVSHRSAFNRYFQQRPRFNQEHVAALIETSLSYPAAEELTLPQPGAAKAFDDAPPSIFLAPLLSESTGDLGYYFDQAEFFGSGSVDNPDALESSSGIRPDDPALEQLGQVNARGQPWMLAHRTKVSLRPGESRRLRYAFGYVQSQEQLALLDKYRGGQTDFLARNTDAWKQQLSYFAPAGDGWLQREMAWHSYYLQSATTYRRYTNTQVVAQGGSYLYGHGLDGATRDYCIFAVVLTYLQPSLAKEILRFVMMTTSPDGQMAYANFGDVTMSNAVMFSKPTDLDLFFFWAMSEYLMATRDTEFLREAVPFYKARGLLDPPIETTVQDHVKRAYEHLVSSIGVGDHNLIKIGTGDWSDGILWFVEDRELAKQKGESTYNTAFAVAVLPRMADAIVQIDPDLAMSMQQQAGLYRQAMIGQWTGQWFLRGWQGNGKPFGQDNLFLEPQVWSLIAGISDPEQSATLVSAIQSQLEAGSALGARIVFPTKNNMVGGLVPGTDVNGGIWHATNSLWTWALSLQDANAAWESFKKGTLTAHAIAYPDLWYGIWSGPDSYNSPESERPGQAAAHISTDLADFPVPNSNSHANPLLALIKLAGIHPTKEGLLIAPTIPLSRWSLQLPLLGIQQDDQQLSGYYIGINQGSMTLSVRLPPQLSTAHLSVTVNGSPADFVMNDGLVQFGLPYAAGQKTSWQIQK